VPQCQGFQTTGNQNAFKSVVPHKQENQRKYLQGHESRQTGLSAEIAAGESGWHPDHSRSGLDYRQRKGDSANQGDRHETKENHHCRSGTIAKSDEFGNPSQATGASY